MICGQLLIALQQLLFEHLLVVLTNVFIDGDGDDRLRSTLT